MIQTFIALQSAESQSGGAGAINLILIVGLVAVFYLFMIRPQQKRQKEIQKFRNSLEKGSKVLTAGGIHGRIVSVKDKSFVIEIAKDVNITVDANSVYPVGTTKENMTDSKTADQTK